MRVSANTINGDDTPVPIDEPEIVEFIPVWQEDMIADRAPTRRVNHITLRGVFPHIQPAFGPAYSELNEHISAAASDLIDNALRLRARTIVFSYVVHDTVYEEREIVSVVMYASVAAVTARETVRTINFDAVTGELLTFACVMGDDFAPLAERILTGWTRDYPEHFYAAATAPLSAYYITDTQLVFLFDEFQISTVPDGVTRLEMNLANIMRLDPIAPAEYRVLEEIYNLKMVPIGIIVRELGFYPLMGHGRATVWSDETQTQVMMEIVMGVNSYGWRGVSSRSLESAPMVLNGRVLIPITFFDRVMPRTTYHVDEDGYIYFLTYNPLR
jgi:hypothetical protein